MKKSIPDSIVVAGHRDHNLLTAIAGDILWRAGGHDALATKFAIMLRQCVDDVIMTPKTGRRSYDELEKTEKTYIGTRVEIELRAMLHLPKGKLDTVILDHDVDIKNTMGSNWMIPTEAIDHPCILVAADEVRAKCYLGLFVAHPEYLTFGQNKDSKKSVSALGFSNIFWLLFDHPYPENFWRTIPPDAIDRIFLGKTGNQRMANLFREVQRQPIARDVVQAVAQQQDFMRRIRSDNGRGTRDILAREGILLLSGHYDAPLIAALGLPHCLGSEFVSCRVVSQGEAQLAGTYGISITWNS
ncbi:NaeI family type II restriction endonuclease [Roseinatronobacter alkalisoli]|uniref:NaeI family type II restriction endonuclease n=1 Tax=Roseinatronobacter alkalisoli TaxID=3028235 RepID=A0ABT5T7E6_9RHOB|nr:NaeI family type II restriction endonuclease [Roseinatronobacter sp. HJB301]MDD7970610.1 NaeI family type II restriction endonuclease [Roseinatronobacter sp. HJB301]